MGTNIENLLDKSKSFWATFDQWPGYSIYLICHTSCIPYMESNISFFSFVSYISFTLLELSISRMKI